MRFLDRILFDLVEKRSQKCSEKNPGINGLLLMPGFYEFKRGLVVDTIRNSLFLISHIKMSIVLVCQFIFQISSGESYIAV